MSSSEPTQSVPEPAPPVIAARSHVESCTPLRRFIGPLPDKPSHAGTIKAERSRLHRLRRETVTRLRLQGVDEEDGPSERVWGEEDGNAVKRGIRHIRVRRRTKEGREYTQEIDLDPGSEHDLSDTGGHQHKKGKKTSNVQVRNGVLSIITEQWSGSSFDIGQEFEIQTDMVESPVALESGTARGMPEECGSSDGNDLARPDSQTRSGATRPSQPIHRPSNRTQSTQDTFYTAQTGPSTLSVSSSNVGQGYHSDSASQQNAHQSVISSVRPLIQQQPQSEEVDAQQRNGSPGLQRLKSVLEVSSFGSAKGKKHGKIWKGKSVSFSVDPVKKDRFSPTHYAAVGNEPPADPEEVLARAGEEVEGTSAGAQAQQEGDSEGEETQDDEVDLQDIDLQGTSTQVCVH